jgi:hypothetical protein
VIQGNIFKQDNVRERTVNKDVIGILPAVNITLSASAYQVMQLLCPVTSMLFFCSGKCSRQGTGGNCGQYLISSTFEFSLL